MFCSLVRDYVLRSERRRLRATLRWIKRAERYYIHNCADIPNLGMCVSFMSTCPWWVPRLGEAFSLLHVLGPEFNCANLTARFPTGVTNDGCCYWWGINIVEPRLRSFAYLKDVYRIKLKLTYV